MKCPCAMGWPIPAISSPKTFCLGARPFRQATSRRNTENYPLRLAGHNSAQGLCVSHSICQERSTRLSWFSASRTSNSAQTSPCKKDSVTVFERAPGPHVMTASSFVVWIVTPKLEAPQKPIHGRMSESWRVQTLEETLALRRKGLWVDTSALMNPKEMILKEPDGEECVLMIPPLRNVGRWELLLGDGNR